MLLCIYMLWVMLLVMLLPVTVSHTTCTAVLHCMYWVTGDVCYVSVTEISASGSGHATDGLVV